MQYAIIDLQTGERLGGLSSSPDITINLPPTNDREPHGGTAHFEKVGQTEPEHAPRYRMVEVDEETPKPSYPAVEVASEREFRDGKEVIRKTYAPDLNAFTAAIEDHIEAVARERQYSSAVSCVSYVADPNPIWSAEAQAFVTWRSAVWAKAFEMLAAVQGGKDIPSVSGMIAGLPVIKWPQA